MAADTDQPGPDKLELLPERNTTAVRFCKWPEIDRNTSRYSSRTETGRVFWLERSDSR